MLVEVGSGVFDVNRHVCAVPWVQSQGQRLYYCVLSEGQTAWPVLKTAGYDLQALAELQKAGLDFDSVKHLLEVLDYPA